MVKKVHSVLFAPGWRGSEIVSSPLKKKSLRQTTQSNPLSPQQLPTAAYMSPTATFNTTYPAPQQLSTLHIQSHSNFQQKYLTRLPAAYDTRALTLRRIR